MLTAAAATAITFSPPAAQAWDQYLTEDIGAPPGTSVIPLGVAAASWDKPLKYSHLGEEYDPGPLFVFVQGQDNQLWTRQHDGGWWSWVPLGGIIQSRPAAVATGPNQLAVFVRGLHNEIWFRRYEGGFGDWETIDGRTLDAPAVASAGDGSLDLFVTGLDHRLWYRHHDGANWAPEWTRVGGYLTSAPTAVTHEDGTIDVFARGGDNHLWQIALQRRGSDEGMFGFTWLQWSRWNDLGGVLSSGPAVATASDGAMVVDVRGTDDRTWRASWRPERSTDGTTLTGWSWDFLIDGKIKGDPAVVSTQADTVDPCQFHILHVDDDTGHVERQYCVENAPVVNIYRQHAGRTGAGYGRRHHDELLSRTAGEGPSPRWSSPEVAFGCFAGPAPKTVPFYRYYYPDGLGDRHEYSTSPATRAAALAAGARDEGILCWIYPTDNRHEEYWRDACALYHVVQDGPPHEHSYVMGLGIAAWMVHEVATNTYYDHYKTPTWGREGYVFSKNGTCSTGDEDRTSIPGSSPPPSPAPAPVPDPVTPAGTETVPGELKYRATFDGDDDTWLAWEYFMAVGESSKVVTKIAVPASPYGGAEYTIGFVKDGKDTNDCGDSAAVVWVEQGKELPASTFASIFGADRPPYKGLHFAACAVRYIGSWPMPPPSLWVTLTLANP